MLVFGAAFVLIVALAAALWPRRPAALVWWATPVVFLAGFWPEPGAIPQFLGLVTVFWPLRAIDAALLPERLSRWEYVTYVLDITRVPESLRRPVPPLEVALRRTLRGAGLAFVALVLFVASFVLQPWRFHPYVSDVGLVVLGAFLFTGLADLLTALLWAAGREQPALHDARFVRAPTLRAFWTAWNGAVSGVLSRAVFEPVSRRIGGRPGIVAGVALSFLASGVLHALPLLVASPDRRASLKLSLAALAFFLVHGAGVLLEGTRLRRLLGRRGGRLLVWVTFAVTAPLYPAALDAALGTLGRGPEGLTWWSLVP